MSPLLGECFRHGDHADQHPVLVIERIPEADAPARPAWPSVDAAEPAEQGGPTARKGFNYQDEIAVGVLLEMLKDANILRVHCETHDDLVIVYRGPDGEGAIAEFVQVKALEKDQLWSVANLCERKKQKAGTSLYEISLGRDRHRETSRFRIVTLRPVNSDLAVLSYPFGAEARTPESEAMETLASDLEARCPDYKSAKGNDAQYWLQNCYWQEKHREEAVREHNFRLLAKLSSEAGKHLLFEQLDTLLVELRVWAKAAGDATWKLDRQRKIISREELRSWWDQRTAELIEGATSPGGGKLADKMRRAGLSDEIILLATDLRRSYAAAARTSRYLAPDEGERLQNRVKSAVLSLSTRFAGGSLDLDGLGFHALCVEQMDGLNANLPAGSEDYSAYLKGCLYDIADRCLLRFDRSGP